MNVWIRGLIAALISGAAGGITSGLGNMIAAPEQFNTANPALLLKSMVITALVAGVVGVAAYLKQSPLPPQ